MFTSALRAHDGALMHFVNHDPVSWVDPEQFGRGVAAGTHRREWVWLAFADDGASEPLARAVWWGPVGSVHPVELRCLLVHPSVPHPEVWAAALIRSGHRAFAEAGAILAPDLVVEVAAARRDTPAVERALAWRRLAAEQAGLPVATERMLPAGDGAGAGGVLVAEGVEPGGPADELLRVTFSARPLGAPSRPALAGAGR